MKWKVPKKDEYGSHLRNYRGNVIFEVEWRETGEFTTNGLDKVRQVEVNGEWYPIKALVE